MTLSKNTRDHEEIRRWAEARSAIPSEVASTHSSDEASILRFQFPGAPHKNDGALREISWDDFFEKFDANDLELIYQEKTAAGEKSNFNKLIHPDSEEHSKSSHKSVGSHESGGAGKNSHKSTGTGKHRAA